MQEAKPFASRAGEGLRSMVRASSGTAGRRTSAYFLRGDAF
jgi:phenylacetate-coenzyme A ligase PaaK-like adenylate-forming protein